MVGETSALSPTPLPAGEGSNRVAVVIGSGSVKCAAALGLLKVLDREGISIDLIVGCSGGSLYAAMIALGRNAARPYESVRSMPRLSPELPPRRSLAR